MRVGVWVVAAPIAFLVQAGCGGDSTGAQAPAPDARGGGPVITGAGGAGSAAGAGGDGPSTSSTMSTWAATASASTGSAGVGGADPGDLCPNSSGPFPGPKVTAPAGEWTWVPVPGAKCRDGSDTGFAVRLHPTSSKVFIYLEGGGACFNATTCAINPAAFGELAFSAWKVGGGNLGLFDANMPENPLRDWSAVYVPYCTGDIHGGAAKDMDVPGLTSPKHQDFLGYANLSLYLERIVPTFAAATQVLLTGVSAGGFGAAYNYDRVAAAFCPRPVTLLDDSGPPMADAFVAPCLQESWRGLWRLDTTLPSGCADCIDAAGGGIVNYTTYIAKRWPHARMGLVSSTRDSTISLFFGFGANGCGLPVPLSGQTYAAGLDDLRAHYLTDPAIWGTYFIDSTVHTYLEGPGFYTTTVAGKKLTTWVAELLDGKPSHVGP